MSTQAELLQLLRDGEVVGVATALARHNKAISRAVQRLKDAYSELDEATDELTGACCNALGLKTEEPEGKDEALVDALVEHFDLFAMGE